MYIELHTRSAFSLLGGASQPQRLVEQAQKLGYPAIALTDQMDMGGVVCLAERAYELGIGGILGAQVLLDLSDFSAIPSEPEPPPSPPLPGKNKKRASEAAQPFHWQGPPPCSLVLLAENEAGYRNISRLITRGRMESPRNRPVVQLAWLEALSEGVVVLDGGVDGPITSLLRRGDRAGAERAARALQRVVAAPNLFLEVQDHLTHEERALFSQVDDLGEHLGIPRVVTGDVRFATLAEKPVYDLMTCVRYRTPLSMAGTRLLPSGEWHLQSPQKVLARWKERPELVHRSGEIAQRLSFRFERLTPKLPHFPIPERFACDADFLAHLTWEGAHLRYPDLTEAHRRQIEHELSLIRRKGMAGYFLITWDIARFCRERGILAQGRGSAANSAVCYCLQITAVDPIGMELLFERFLSEGREDYPDIDIDISHEWREEAIQYTYQRYGREYAALVCEQIRYRHRSAVRDAAWALGFEPDQTDRLADVFGHYEEVAPGDDRLVNSGARVAGVHPGDPRLPLLSYLVEALQGLPRHRSIHVGGMVLTAQPLCEIVPIEPASMLERTVIQWEKDDLPYSNLAKFDLLGLGMLSMLQKALVELSRQRGHRVDLADIPQDDRVYDSLCRADTVGVFQIESRAQMATLPRLKPRRFYDLVVEIALIRPGPIQGQMVHPYLRRRAGEEAVTYLHPELAPILQRTLGVPIFQEQVMRIAIELAGFSPSQADELRRAMGFRRYSPRMETLRGDLHRGMQARDIGEEIRNQIIEFLTAFGHYGFPESHSASFALLAYASAWLKVHHAPLFAATLINSQPMGFYSVATIVQDARQHGVVCRPPDLGLSDWDCTLETLDPPPAEPNQIGQGPWPHVVRIGLRCVEGMGAESKKKLEAARAQGPFRSIRDVVVRTGLPSAALASLAQAGAFDSLLGETSGRERRREALWMVLREGRIPVEGLASVAGNEGEPVTFEPIDRSQRIVQDYVFTGLSTEGHPMEMLRPAMQERRVLSSAELRQMSNGRWVRVAGLVIVRQRPGTAKGFVFISLEDETGMTNVIVTPQLYERYHDVIASSRFLEIHGVAQIEGQSVQVRGREFFSLHARGTPSMSRDFH